MDRKFSLRQSITQALRVILGFACASLSGCLSLGYEEDRFATSHVLVVHSERHCKDVKQSDGSEFPDADFVGSRVDGIGRLAATRTAWEVHARQLAAERDADISLVRLCDGKKLAFQYSQVQMWRTRGFNPTVYKESPPQAGTLVPPPGATYGARLQNIFECFEKARVSHDRISTENEARLAKVRPTEFFSSGRYFPGYAKVDKYYRPTRVGELGLSMILSDRSKADWAASIYLALSPEGRSLLAGHYMICLFDRGYSAYAIGAPQSIDVSETHQNVR
jgi:hypothetical protein